MASGEYNIEHLQKCNICISQSCKSATSSGDVCDDPVRRRIKVQVHALERNLTPYRPSPAYRPAVALMLKKAATRWRRIPLNILMTTQASEKKTPRCLRNKKPHYCAQTSPQMAPLLSSLNPVRALKSYHIKVYFNNILPPTCLLSNMSLLFSSLN